jgi:heme O synthase-like polyprenyltransferase
MNHRSIAQYLLAGVVIIGFFAVLSLMLWKDKTGADILVGGLAAAFGSVVGYFYGSSAGSARKDELMAGK